MSKTKDMNVFCINDTKCLTFDWYNGNSPWLAFLWVYGEKLTKCKREFKIMLRLIMLRLSLGQTFSWGYI